MHEHICWWLVGNERMEKRNYYSVTTGIPSKIPCAWQQGIIIGVRFGCVEHVGLGLERSWESGMGYWEHYVWTTERMPPFPPEHEQV